MLTLHQKQRILNFFYHLSPLSPNSAAVTLSATLGDDIWNKYQKKLPSQKFLGPNSVDIFLNLWVAQKNAAYTHNFSFRCDIICPVSFAIFLCFSLPLHGIAMPHICRPSMVGRIRSEFLCCRPGQCRALIERNKEK